jgi:hypothetical protein
MSIELLTDDEALREQGMTEGNKNISGITIRPMTALSLSWLQRNNIFDDEGDSMQKTAAFVFLHSEPREVIRSVVNNRAAFLDAVDDWLDEKFPHHTQLLPYTELMTDAMNVYLASSSRAAQEPGGVIPSAALRKN